MPLYVYVFHVIVLLCCLTCYLVLCRTLSCVVRCFVPHVVVHRMPWCLVRCLVSCVVFCLILPRVYFVPSILSRLLSHLVFYLISSFVLSCLPEERKASDEGEHKSEDRHDRGKTEEPGELPVASSVGRRMRSLRAAREDWRARNEEIRQLQSRKADVAVRLQGERLRYST